MPFNRIRALRRSKGLSQKALGAILGVSQTTVSAWECGKNCPDLGTVFVLCDLFGVSPAFLMGAEVYE